MRGKSSSQLHTKKTRNGLFAGRPPVSKKLILGIIAIIAVIVISAVCGIFLFSNERQVKNQISALANEYYENYLYQDNLASSADLAKYESYGFAPITLRQLLLYDNQKNSGFAPYLTKYCDENTTTIKFYPDAPYGRRDYHTDYTYSCEF